MNKKIFVANWKSHKTVAESYDFISQLREMISTVNLDNKEIIIAPSFPSLMVCHDAIVKFLLPIKLAAQNISSFAEGAYTGEVNGKQIKEFADYVIIGHSERKRYYHETEGDVESKVKEAKDAGLTVIQCIQDQNSQIHGGADVVAYEPPNAISTFGVGEPENPDRIKEVFSKISEDTNEKKLLYGGSVDSKNIKSYAEIDKCSGFLIGGASLKPDSFIDLLSQW